MDARKVLLTAVSIIVLTGAGIIYILARDDDKDKKDQKKTAQISEQDQNNQSSAEKAGNPAPNLLGANTTGLPATGDADHPGEYIAYSTTAFEGAESRRWVFFYSDQSTTAQTLDQSIQTGQLPLNVTIFKADYATSGMLRQQYGVTAMGAVVEIDAFGNSLGQFTPVGKTSLQDVVTALGA